MKKKDSLNEDDISLPKKIFLVFALVVFGTVMTISLIAITGIVEVKTESGDISSWVTMIVSIGIGSGIAISILIYSKNDQEKIKQILSDIKQMSSKIETINKNQAKYQEQKQDHAHSLLSYHIEIINKSMNNLKKGITESTETSVDGKHKFKINHIKAVKESITTLENLLNQFIVILHPNVVIAIKNIVIASKEGEILDDPNFLIFLTERAEETIKSPESSRYR